MEKNYQPNSIPITPNGLSPELVENRANEYESIVFVSYKKLFGDVPKSEVPSRMLELLKKLPECILIVDDITTFPKAKCGEVTLEDLYENNRKVIKAIVLNYAQLGEPSVIYSKTIPTYVVYWLQADLWDQDPGFMDYAFTAKKLFPTIEFICEMTGNDNLLVFDGIEEGIHVSAKLAETLIK